MLKQQMFGRAKIDLLALRIPSPAWSSAMQLMEMELERPDGARLRLRCPESTTSVAALMRAFLEGVQ
jgi:hypothetical protein